MTAAADSSSPAVPDDRVLDLPAYLARIGFSGTPAPDLATLSRLVEGQVRAIPFENLDVLLGREIRLDLASVQAKLVHGLRGGYCFEQCTLLAAVLRRLGFECVAHTARVTAMTGREAAPRTHMFLVVTLAEGRFVADPGFGGLAPRWPVPLVDRGEAPADLPLAWLRREDPYWVMHLRRGDTPMEGWISTLDRDQFIDFVLGNHYTSTHPSSAFRQRLTFRAYTPEGSRVTIMNQELTRWDGDRPGEPERVRDRAQLRTLLRELMGVDLPEIETLRVPAVPEWA